KTADTCFTVTNPADYDVEGDCKIANGTWSQSDCSTADYKRRCTQSLDVTINGKSTNATYVSLSTASNPTTGLGTRKHLAATRAGVNSRDRSRPAGPR